MLVPFAFLIKNLLLPLISFLHFPPTDYRYLVPLLCVVFCLLCLICIIVCVWWTRKRRKERERTSQAATDANVNNHWEPLRLVVGREQPLPQQLKENNREAEQERKKLMGSSCRTRDDGEEDEEEEEETEGELEEECGGAEAGKQLVYKYSKTAVQSSEGLICTLHSSSSPHRTQGYSPKDNRWKNVSAVFTGQKQLRDHCV